MSSEVTTRRACPSVTTKPDGLSANSNEPHDPASSPPSYVYSPSILRPGSPLSVVTDPIDSFYRDHATLDYIHDPVSAEANPHHISPPELPRRIGISDERI